MLELYNVSKNFSIRCFWKRIFGWFQHTSRFLTHRRNRVYGQNSHQPSTCDPGKVVKKSNFAPRSSSGGSKPRSDDAGVDSGGA